MGVAGTVTDVVDATGQKREKGKKIPQTLASAALMPVPRKRLRFSPSTSKPTKNKAIPVDWSKLPFSGDPLSGVTVVEMMETATQFPERKVRKAQGRRQTKVDKLRHPADWLDFETKLRRRLDGQDF